MLDRYSDILNLLKDLIIIKSVDIDYFNHIVSVIDLLPLRYSYVLKRHYIDNKKLSSIAYEIYYSERSVQRFHHDGIFRLESYYEILFKK